jgi:tRNA (guanine37-N1)-methyltransferase
MKITILTLFPNMFDGPLSHSILKRAQENNIIELQFINIRDFGIGKHKLVDDTPYGGGVGMVLKVDVLEKAIETSKCKKNTCKECVILLDAPGERYSQEKAHQLTGYDHLILLCGHYEGFDERIRKFVDMELSIGDYVLTGGEIPAMVIIDSVARLLPGTLGKDESSMAESFQKIETDNETIQVLEYPHYTKPQIYKKMVVPEILLSGNHKKIEEWRKQEAIIRTKKRRPDLLKS